MQQFLSVMGKVIKMKVQALRTLALPEDIISVKSFEVPLHIWKCEMWCVKVRSDYSSRFHHQVSLMSHRTTLNFFFFFSLDASIAGCRALLWSSKTLDPPLNEPNSYRQQLLRRRSIYCGVYTGFALMFEFIHHKPDYCEDLNQAFRILRGAKIYSH